MTCFDEDGAPKERMMTTSQMDRLIISLHSDICIINETLNSSISVQEKEKFIQDVEGRLALVRKATEPFMNVPELERQLQRAEDAVDHLKKAKIPSSVRKDNGQ